MVAGGVARAALGIALVAGCAHVAQAQSAVGSGQQANNPAVTGSTSASPLIAPDLTADAPGDSAQDNAVTYGQTAPARQRARGNPMQRAKSKGALAGSADYAGDGGGDGVTTGEDRALPGRRLGVFTGDAHQRRISIRPYIEAQQVFQDYITPGNDVLTYTVLAAGADAVFNGRNNQGIVSLRYERRIGWTDSTYGNGNGSGLTGIARMSSAIAGDTLRMDYGGYANRTYVSASGANFATGAASGDALTQVWSVYAGPTLTTHVGPVGVVAAYHAGYSATDVGGTLNSAGGSTAANLLAHSVVQDARVAASVKPGQVAPVGLGAEAGLYQENVSNLDQQVLDKHVRGEVRVPVSNTAQLVGGIGYEHVTVGSRDAVRDANGDPVVDAKGRYVTDYSTPRQIAFDADGLIWDVGVVWRPSPRTALEAHVGRRYGQLGGYGSFYYRPSARSSVNLMVYNSIGGFGGQMTTSLFGLPTDFSTVRDPITGSLGSCVVSSQGGGCIGGATGSLNSTIYRGRGVALSYMYNRGRWQTGIGAGYDRREYLAAPDTVLAVYNGKDDDYYWVSAYVGTRLSEKSSLNTTLSAYRFDSGLTSSGDLTAVRAVAMYQYYMSHHLSASASLGIDGITRDSLEDIWVASGSVGMRYAF
ncbi:MAG TPA: preprotein translocase subunit YajC [Novosphingobium sp.]|nr:preprotein translocase subunit YajC [Novosphingobium sp.]